MATDTVKIIVEAQDKTGSAFSSAGKSLKTLGTVALSVGAAGVAALGAAAVIGGKKMVGLGADANETASLLENSLGPATAGYNDTLRDFAEAANRSFFELQAGGATFVAMTKAMGMGEQQASDFSTQMVEAAVDLGSFFNVSDDAALADLQSALAGSSETMQKYGIDVRETTLKQLALDRGLIESASDVIPRQARAMLLLEAVQNQASDAMGDAARTSDSWQNSLRGLRGRLTDTMTAIGQQLIPALAPFLTLAGDIAEAALPRLQEAVTSLLPYIEDLGNFVRGFISNLQSGMGPIDAAIDAFLTWTGVGEGLSDSMRDIVLQIATVKDNIMAALAPVTAAIGEFVSWQDVLIALGIAIAAVVIPAIGAVVAAIGPVILVFAAVAAAVAVLRNAWENNWGGIQEKTAAVMAFIQNIIETVTAVVQAIWTQHGDAIQAKASAIWTRVQALVDAAMGFIQGVIESVASGIQAFWGSYHSELLGLATGIWEGIKSLVGGTFDAIVGLLDAFVALFRGDWDGFLEGIEAAFQGALEAILGALAGLWTGIAPLLGALWEDFVAWFNDMDWASLGQTIVDGILGALAGLGGAIGGAISGAVGNIESRFGIDIPGFAEGTNGWLRVPGAAGAPQLIMVHGGEAINVDPTGRGGGVVNNYYLTANYRNQRETSLAQDIRTMELLRA